MECFVKPPDIEVAASITGQAAFIHARARIVRPPPDRFNQFVSEAPHFAVARPSPSLHECSLFMNPAHLIFEPYVVCFVCKHVFCSKYKNFDGPSYYFDLKNAGV